MFWMKVSERGGGETREEGRAVVLNANDRRNASVRVRRQP
jgi:hypothetical protein